MRLNITDLRRTQRSRAFVTLVPLAVGLVLARVSGVHVEPVVPFLLAAVMVGVMQQALP
jgi:hypothetical protein